MNKPCASCAKTVYPMEQLKCLDQVWHKACFKCTSCNMTLNMKTYKGFEKKPYCNAHYPQPSKFTVVTDTPENQRLAQNTKLVSNIKYHEDYEKNKGTKISVTEDPLTKQQMQNTHNISQISYHGKVDQRNEMEAARRNSLDDPDQDQHRSSGVVTSQVSLRHRPSDRTVPGVASTPEERDSQRQSYSTYFTQRKNSQSDSYTVEVQKLRPDKAVGKISDYDPEDRNSGEDYGSRNSYQRNSSITEETRSYPQVTQYQQPVMQPQAPTQIPAQKLPTPVSSPQPVSKGLMFQALYSYAKADADEVSFNEGDIIIHGDVIDEGWMYGTVERTMERGMLPSNYMQPLN